MTGEQQAGQHGEVATPSRVGQKILQKGEVLAGNFEIEGVIGQGGMAIVYRAIQKSLSRPVAIKALHDRFARDSEFISRFEAEAGALASLSHPNIVNIIDRGHDGTCYYFVMEYVEGETLDQLIIRNALTINDWRRVVQACCEGLEYVHRRGVVHRDIKPSNILVGSENLIKIGDFGIAHIVQGEGEDTTAKPKAIGTAHYMAPEQTSDPASVDHRADIYSLGVTFYKMLARRLPAGDDMPMPSEVNGDVPVAVDRVIAKAIEKNRDARYENVRLFCDDMMKALRDTSTSIVSMLNTRRGKAGGALYTGADFRATPKPTPELPEKQSSKRIKSEGRGKPPKAPKSPKPVKGADIPDSGPISTSALLHQLTPLPVPGDRRTPPSPTTPTPRRSIEEAAPTETKEHPPAAHRKAGEAKPATENSAPSTGPRIAIAAGVLGVVLIIVVAIAALMNRGKTEEPLVLDPNVTITEQKQQILDDVIREKAALDDEIPGS
ncbi:MAG: eukaryotic-like serine/threonine-protein kinase [Candidatus Sumerlaeota bacterium]|nr:eukaryotic-like serine/threonine-protein kinase [Candidatus Sumerlaeota bacterium]